MGILPQSQYLNALWYVKYIPIRFIIKKAKPPLKGNSAFYSRQSAFPPPFSKSGF